MLAPDRPYDSATSLRDHTDPAGTGLEDLVAHQQVFHLVAELAHLDHAGLGLVDPALWEIVLQATDAVEVRVEAPAGGRLDLIEDVLTIAEGEEHRGDRTELYPHVAEEQRDVGDAATARTRLCGCTGHEAAPRWPSASRRPG